MTAPVLASTDPDCLCGDPKSLHRLGRKGCKTVGCGCDRFEPREVPAQTLEAAGPPEPGNPLELPDQKTAAEDELPSADGADVDTEDVDPAMPVVPGVDYTAPAPAPAQAGAGVTPDPLPAVPQSTVELLQAAAASPHQKTRSLGAKVAALLADLNGRITVERRRAEAAATRAAERAEANAKRAAERAEAGRRIAELQDELAKAREAFRAAGGIPGPERARPAAGVPAKTIRAWAAEAGIECSTTGRVGQPVVDAYYAAHPDAPRP